jgi:NitT/TauT family transport system substrate-binding protein
MGTMGIWHACIGAILAGLCGPAGAQELKTWRHGVLEPKNDAGFVMMASHRGFDEKHGLKIETVAMKNGQIQIRALLSGELDSIESGAGEELVAGAHGADIKILGCPWPGLPQSIMVRSTVATPHDLKGKTIATSAPGSLPDLVARVVLEKYRVSPSEVKFASIGGDLDRYKALAAGIVDAAVISSEYLPVAPKEIKLLLAGRDVIPNYMRQCIATTGQQLATRRDDAVRFMAAEMEALHYATTHREETLKLAREISGAKLDDPRPEFVFDETVKHGDIDPDLTIPAVKLKWMQEQLIATGNITKSIELSTIIDASVRLQALGLVGH